MEGESGFLQVEFLKEDAFSPYSCLVRFLLPTSVVQLWMSFPKGLLQAQVIITGAVHCGA